MTNIITFVKGMIIGGTMLVPGVSGGSMAIILGIYNKLISSISSFNKKKSENFLFLLIFVLGAGLGMILFANPLLSLIETFPKPMLFLILGIVAGGLPMIYRESNVRNFSFSQPLYIMTGILIVLAVQFLPSNIFGTYNSTNLFYITFLFIAGFILAIALILPGISVSFLLLVLGLYNQTISAVSHLDLSFLIPLALGLFIGIITTTRILEKAMNEYSGPTYLIIIGFILGSMVSAFPGKPENPLQWGICIILSLIGFITMNRINRRKI